MRTPLTKMSEVRGALMYSKDAQEHTLSHLHDARCSVTYIYVYKIISSQDSCIFVEKKNNNELFD